MNYQQLIEERNSLRNLAKYLRRSVQELMLDGEYIDLLEAQRELEAVESLLYQTEITIRQRDMQSLSRKISKLMAEDDPNGSAADYDARRHAIAEAMSMQAEIEVEIERLRHAHQ